MSRAPRPREAYPGCPDLRVRTVQHAGNLLRGPPGLKGVTMTTEVQAPTDAQAQFAAFVSGRGPALQRTAYLLTGDWGLAGLSRA